MMSLKFVIVALRNVAVVMFSEMFLKSTCVVKFNKRVKTVERDIFYFFFLSSLQ
jgi:hypothetical protein